VRPSFEFPQKLDMPNDLRPAMVAQFGTPIVHDYYFVRIDLTYLQVLCLLLFAGVVAAIVGVSLFRNRRRK
jgi:hypothetical protein